jgi:hypothetical protein
MQRAEAKEKALAEHIAAYSEDASRTVWGLQLDTADDHRSAAELVEPLVPGVGLNDLQLSKPQRIKIFTRSILGFRAGEDSYVSGTLGVGIFHYVWAALGGIDS